MKKLKIGCGWWGFRQKLIQEHFEISSKFNFRTLEFGIGDELQSTISLNATDQEIKKIQNLSEKYGINIPFVTIENDFTLSSRKKHQNMIETVFKKISLAAKLDVSHIRIFAGFESAEEITGRIYNQVIDAFKKCTEKCSKNNIKISVETHGDIVHRNNIAFHKNTITTDPHYLERLMKDLPKRVGFLYDPGNVKAVRPYDKNYCLDIINDRINYCHLKDWRKKDGGWEPVAIGDDDLDYAKLLPEIKFDGIYLIEYEPLDDLQDGIHRSLKYLKNLGYSIQFT